MSLESFPSPSSEQNRQEPETSSNERIPTLEELELDVTRRIKEKQEHPDDLQANENLKKAWERFAEARRKREGTPES